MINDSIQDAEKRMQKSIEVLKVDFSKLRSGRAHTGLLEQIMVSYYGNEVPITQVANIAVEDARTLTVTPWEKSMLSAIEKAIMTSDLGLNPSNAGTIIRVPLPPLTEERRKDMIKIVRAEAENARVAMRTFRRDANTHIKDLLKNKKISEDDEKRGQELVQKLTDKYVQKVDELLAAKEKELMEV